VEKARRVEVNERLDELSRVLDMVELPIPIEHGFEVTKGETQQGDAPECCIGCVLDGGPCDAAQSSKGSGGPAVKDGQHRVLLLARATETLKALRSAYDSRTQEVVRK
jgi:hypothetical protein